MEVAWRLAKTQARKVSVTKLTAMEQDASIMNIIERLSILTGSIILLVVN
jgi:hypothetical protein